MEKKKSEDLETGCNCAGISVSVGTASESVVVGTSKGREWSSYTGCFCLRCGAGQVMEIAVADGWLDFGPGIPDTWKFEEYKKLVHLCDDFCDANMTPEAAAEHKAKINALIEKLGV